LGPSGAGKICLAFSCAKRGWTYVSDDGCSLVRGRGDAIVLGKPHQIRFRTSAADLFPELGGWPASIARDGDPSIEVDTAAMPEIATATSARVEAVVFLSRSAGGPARITCLDKAEAQARLESELAMWEQHVHEEQKASLRTLVELPTVTLRYNDSDIDAAIDELDAFLQQ
jgi:hypothetical protein